MNTESNQEQPREKLFSYGLQPLEFWRVKAEDMLAAFFDPTSTRRGLETGIANLDKLTRLVPGEVTLIAMRPSMGKTSLGVQIIEFASGSLNPLSECAAIFSAEMPGWSLLLRMACARCGVSYTSLRQASASPTDRIRVLDSLEYLSTLPIYIDDESQPTTDLMEKRLQELNEVLTVRLMLFDFAELAGDTGRGEERMSDVAKRLKNIAKRYNIPVVVLSQLNREVEARKDKMPSLADLRGSGMLEQLADSVWLGVRPKYYLDRAVPIDLQTYGGETLLAGGRDLLFLNVAKNRNGETGMVTLEFIPERTLFRDVDITRIELND